MLFPGGAKIQSINMATDEQRGYPACPNTTGSTAPDLKTDKGTKKSLRRSLS